MVQVIAGGQTSANAALDKLKAELEDKDALNGVSIAGEDVSRAPEAVASFP